MLDIYLNILNFYSQYLHRKQKYPTLTDGFRPKTY